MVTQPTAPNGPRVQRVLLIEPNSAQIKAVERIARKQPTHHDEPGCFDSCRAEHHQLGHSRQNRDIASQLPQVEIQVASSTTQADELLQKGEVELILVNIEQTEQSGWLWSSKFHLSRPQSRLWVYGPSEAGRTGCYQVFSGVERYFASLSEATESLLLGSMSCEVPVSCEPPVPSVSGSQSVSCPTVVSSEGTSPA